MHAQPHTGSQLKAGALLTYLTGFLQIVVNLLFTAALARILGREEYGLYLLLASMVAYVSVFDFGLNNTISRYIAQYRAQNDRHRESNLLFYTFALYGVLAAIILTIGLVVSPHVPGMINELSPEHVRLAQSLFQVLIFNMALSLPMGAFAAILVGYEKFVVTRVLSILRILLMPVIAFPLLLAGCGTLAVVLVTTGTNVLFGACNAWYAMAKLGVRIRFFEWDTALLREMLRYSWFVFLGVIADQVLWNASTVVIGILKNPGQVSVFGSASQLCNYFASFGAALTGVFLPRATQLVVSGAERPGLTAFLVRVGRMQSMLVFMVLGGFAACGQAFVRIWLGEGFAQVYPLALVMMIPIAFNLARAIALSIIQAQNRHGYRSNMYLFVAVVYSVGCFFLTRQFDIMITACAFALAVAASNLWIDWYYHTRGQMDMWAFYKQIAGILIAMAAGIVPGLLIRLLPLGNIVTVLLQGGAFLLCYIGILWCWVMNDGEKKLVTSLIRWRGRVHEGGAPDA